MNAFAMHLLESTVFGCAVALLIRYVTGASPTIRHWLWFAASIKFALPFSLLKGAGQWLATLLPLHRTAVQLTYISWEGHVAVPATFPSFARQTAPASFAHWPLLIASAEALWLAGFGVALAVGTAQWWRFRAIVRAAEPVRSGVAFRFLQHLEGSARREHPAIELRVAEGIVEPGVFGIFRPRLILPHQILNRLTVPQLQALILHEVCHVRRWDNLLGAIHMAVQAVFWFHPLLHVIGARMRDEREHACDEYVVRTQREPRAYAETILAACEFCLRSPLPCVAGVGAGTDLKLRIERIMNATAPSQLPLTRKLLIASLAVFTLCGPLFLGLWTAPPVRAQAPATAAAPTEFEVATIKPTAPGERGVGFGMHPGGRLTLTNTTVRDMVMFAYQLKPFQIAGGPPWIFGMHYDVTAKSPIPDATPEQMRVMMQHLLKDRFQLSFRQESKDAPVYALVVAKGGPKLEPAKEGEQNQMMINMRREINAKGVEMTGLADMLSRIAGRIVQDETGIKGKYNVTLKFTPDETMVSPDGGGPEPAAADASGPSLLTALQEQLGLKLEARKAPVHLFVIENASKPTEN